MNFENKKQIIIILVAIGLGGVAAILMGEYIKSSVNDQTKMIAREFKKADTGVIGELEKMRGALIKLESRQANLVKQQQVLEEKAKTFSTRPQMAQNDQNEGTIFSYVTPPGKRAITIKIDPLSAVGGLISPGDMVDVIATLQIPKSSVKKEKKDVTSVLFQNLQVLAVGANFKARGNTKIYQENKSARSLNVTLAVGPDEAGLITFAQANGKLQLALRSPSERGIRVLQVASWDTLSDYVLDRQGTELNVPKKKISAKATDNDDEEVEPFVQIFRGGREL